MDCEESRLYGLASYFSGGWPEITKNSSRVAKKWIRRYWNYRNKHVAMKFDTKVVINGISRHYRYVYSKSSQIADRQTHYGTFYRHHLIGKIGKHYVFEETFTEIDS